MTATQNAPLVGDALVVRGLPLAGHTSRLVVISETRQSRLAMRDFGFPDTAASCFEIAETEERLILKTSVRVYEEVSIRREMTERIVTISDTIRRQKAELIVEGDGVTILAHGTRGS